MAAVAVTDSKRKKKENNTSLDFDPELDNLTAMSYRQEINFLE